MIVGVVVTAAVLLIGWWLLLGRAEVQATATVDPDVTISCSGATSVTPSECESWGDEILELDPPSTTFEMQDISHLAIDRPLFGFGSPCQVQYFLQRYPDDPVWDSDVPCH
jgi:hypothetical protein